MLEADGIVNAASGRADPLGEGALMDAWAVLTETEAVGGPEEKMDRLGVRKSDALALLDEEVAKSSSGTRFSCLSSAPEASRVLPFVAGLSVSGGVVPWVVEGGNVQEGS